MSPRRGGEADKLGNRYEAAWTVMHLLFVLQGRGRSLLVEDTGDLAHGSEFTYRDADSIQVHQLKRQNGLINNWTVTSLKSLGVWTAARVHVHAGRQYHFASTIPARTIEELADRSRQADSLEQYINEWISANERLPPVFDELASAGTLEDSRTAYDVLRGTYIRVYGEREINHMNDVLAEAVLEGGSGKAIAASLSAILSGSIGVVLTRDGALTQLREYGVALATASALPRLLEQVDGVTQSWLDTVQRQLIRPVLARPEADDLSSLILDEEQFTLVTGEAGGGKSAVLQQVVSKLQAESVRTLAFRLDRLDSFGSTLELGVKLGLDRSPVSALAVAAGNGPSVLVVDQLDAASFASGRMPNSLDAVVDLVHEAKAFPSMRIVWVCRQFDVDNDERIRAVVKQQTVKKLRIGLLSETQVDDAVRAMGIDATRLGPEQLRLLQTPFNLSILNAVADEGGILAFDGSNALLDAYWERKRRDSHQRRAGVRFDRVVKTVAEAISIRQTLSIPSMLLDIDDLANDADVLVSEHILTRDGSRLAFAHEAIFDYAFARSWVSQGVSMTHFLTNDAQELFRRGQLRQIMTFMRSVEPDRYFVEVRELLAAEEVRFHLKDVALAVLGGMHEPSAGEATAVLRVVDSVRFKDRLWRSLTNPAWFRRFDFDGLVEQWLAPDSERRPVAVELLARAVKVYPERVAELIRRCDLGADVTRYVLRFADVGLSDQMFMLLLDSIRNGYYAGFESWLWLDVHNLPKSSTDKSMTLLQVFLEGQPDPLAITGSGKVERLTIREHSLHEFVRECSALDPLRFGQVVVPYAIRVMQLTRDDHDRFGYPFDKHFGAREREDSTNDELDAALVIGAVGALEKLAEQAPLTVQPFLDLLAGAEMDSAQYILYRALIALGERHADWAAQYVLGDPRRLFCGWRSNSVWTTRRLLQVISPHISDSDFCHLEEMVRDVRFPWESKTSGYYAFTLLSALTETRMSALGRRRLEEYRRKFNRDEPGEPEGIEGGFIGPPIQRGAASKMRDENWLKAIRKHAADRSNWSTFTGGARELSHVLRDQTKEQPARFAALSMSFDSETHPSYGAAVLMGLGDADALPEPDVAFNAVRHLASLLKDEHVRWLGWALRPYMASTPLDIIELVRDHALAAADPVDDGVRFRSERDDLDANSDLEMSAINTVRGSLVEALGNLLVYDKDGSRTAAVAPVLRRFASDSSVAVRVSVAHLLAVMLRFDRAAALEALPILLVADDVLLTASASQKLLTYVGNSDPRLVTAVLDRMLTSVQPSVRRVGGRLAAYAALEWGVTDRLDAVESSDDPSARRGAAEVCAARLPQTSNVTIAKRVLSEFASDSDGEVRKAVAGAVPALRGQALGPFKDILSVVVEANSYEHALPQMLFTLEYAPDKVDELIVLTARRFVEVDGANSADLRTGAAGDARHVGKLVIRALAQSTNTGDRSDLLDVLDGLLLAGSYGIEDLVSRSERGYSVDESA